jgi:hypothetical protein|eukprot:2260105-Prymnesium_polylepis.2
MIPPPHVLARSALAFISRFRRFASADAMAAKETPYIPPLLLRRGALWDEGVSMLERHRANNPHSARRA